MTEPTDKDKFQAAITFMEAVIVTMSDQFNVRLLVVITRPGQSAIIGNHCPGCAVDSVIDWMEETGVVHLEVKQGDKVH